jgi:hypothetical protein
MVARENDMAMVTLNCAECGRVYEVDEAEMFKGELENGCCFECSDLMLDFFEEFA